MTEIQTFCQSCGMPMNDSELFGTEISGEKNDEYCRYCYDKGNFSQPNLTMEEMIDFCTSVLKEDGMEEEKAKTMLKNTIPFLKRWKKNEPTITPKIIQKEAFTVLGISSRTSNAAEITGDGEIPKIWDRFFSKEIQEQFSKQGNETPIIGLYSNYESDVFGEYTFAVGKEISNKQTVIEGFQVLNVPQAKYAVFTTEVGPVLEIVPKAWSAIWQWFEENNCERAYTGDFEKYDERSIDPNEAQIDIFVAIR